LEMTDGDGVVGGGLEQVADELRHGLSRRKGLSVDSEGESDWFAEGA
jgi:hypothetical protein